MAHMKYNIRLETEVDRAVEVLCIGPLSVHPEYQGKARD